MRIVASAVRDAPHRSELHASIGNGFVRRTRYLEAIAAYRAAVAADPSNAPARLALAELLHVAHDPEAQEQLHLALNLQRVYPASEGARDRVRVLMLLRDAPYSVNLPLEIIADAERIALHKCYVEAGSNDALPPFDLAFCAFGYARAAEPAIDASSRFVTEGGVRCINDPSRLIYAARERLRETVRDVPGVVVPDVRIVDAARMAITGATLVRPVDTHAGIGLALVNNDAELRAHLKRRQAERYHVAPFVNYASEDGYFRKYRAIVIDGVAYPYHEGISPRWMVHYRNAPMAEYTWMRQEEAAFLARPRATIVNWDALAKLALATGLDYVGVDFAQLADGSVLVFEADPAMLVHDEDPAGLFDYKREAVGNIRRALTKMLMQRSGRDDREGRTRAV